MFLTCKLFKINSQSEIEPYVKEILTGSRGKVYTYNKYLTLEREEGQEFYFYISNIYHGKKGRLVEFYYDEPFTLPQINKEKATIEKKTVKITIGPLFLHLFEEEPLTNFISIFAGGKIPSKVRVILRELLKDKISGSIPRPLFDIIFLIEEKQGEIRNIPDFMEVGEIMVEEIADYYIDWAWLKGSKLEESPEYTKYVESPLRGKLRLLALRFHQRLYYLYNDARIFTRQADISNILQRFSEIDQLYEIIVRLYNINAIRVLTY